MPKIGYDMRKILVGKSDPHKLGFTVLYILSPHATINSHLINLPLSRTVLIIHVRDAQGHACEGRASKETRMAAYKMSSRPNLWNRVLYQRDIL